MIQRLSLQNFEPAIRLLQDGQVLAVPTDTVFGFCALASSQEAMERLIKLKQRPETKSFPVMVENITMMKTIGEVHERTEKIVQHLLPGPLTLVIPKAKKVPTWVTGGKDTIAVRVADPVLLQKIIHETGPLFMTSANRSGESVAKSLDELEHQFPEGLAGMVEGQPAYQKASTILDCTQETLRILREGPLSLEDIEGALYEG